MEYFGTDGIRKNADFFSLEFLQRFANAIVQVFRECECVLARDTRVSGSIIESNLSKCLNAVGANVIVLGMTATPVLALYTKMHNANVGIMISASHNPPEDNGLKVFDKEGCKINTSLEKIIESKLHTPIVTANKIGVTFYEKKANDEYVKYLLEKTSPNLTGVELALDTANGATSVVAKSLFSHLGCKTYIINEDISGHNINKDCGAIYPQALEQFMKANNIELGFSFDGDGDRVVCRINNKTLNGDHILAVLAEQMLADNTLAHNGVVGTVMSNLGLERALAKKGITLHRVGVGDKNVMELIKKEGYTLGGEQSGHIVNTLYQNTGDGMLIALLLTQLYFEGKINTNTFFKDYPQILTSIALPQGESIPLNIEKLINAEESKRLGVNVVIRKSGTEPIIRVMVQGEEAQVVATLSKELTQKIREMLWRKN